MTAEAAVISGDQGKSFAAHGVARIINQRPGAIERRWP